jgi:hypothetical protein
MIDETPINRETFRFVPKKWYNPLRLKVNQETTDFITNWAKSRKTTTGRALEEIIAHATVQALKPEHVQDWKEKYLEQKAKGAYISYELTLGKKPRGKKKIDDKLPKP